MTSEQNSTVTIERFTESWGGRSVQVARVHGDTPNDIIDALLPFIRSISQDFYRKELLIDLEREGYSIVDVHAGQGTYYRVSLNETEAA